MSIDLTEDLIRDPVKAGELECFLSSRFKIASETQSGNIVYGDRNENMTARIKIAGETQSGDIVNENRLEVKYDNKGKMTAIQWLNDDSEDMARDLVSEAGGALYGDHGHGVGKNHVFPGYRIQGFVRVKNDIQIVPLPDEAPKPHALIAKHPGLLVYSYPKSSNQRVDQFRHTEREREILLLLNVLLRGGLTRVSSISNSQWVFVRRGGRVESEFCSLGYVTKAIPQNVDSTGFFSEDSWQPVQKIPANEYYEKRGYHVGDVFCLPDNFEKSLAAYGSLSTDDRKRFLLAAHWYRCFDDTWLISRSLAYSVLVFALEALMEPAEELSKCDTCGLITRESIAKRFQALIDKYSVGVSRSSVLDFAKLRSKYVHGGGLMPSDEEVIHAGLSPKQIQEFERFDELFYPCRRILINWLLHSDRTASQEK